MEDQGKSDKGQLGLVDGLAAGGVLLLLQNLHFPLILTLSLSIYLSLSISLCVGNRGHHVRLVGQL